jgi:uncharacterized membrane protein YeaQ/YmgE (transglycosylase-associated protein family)
MPGKEPGGLILTTLLGIGGAFVGRFLGGIIGLYATSLFGEIVSATLGAILILFVYNKFRK